MFVARAMGGKSDCFFVVVVVVVFLMNFVSPGCDFGG